MADSYTRGQKVLHWLLAVLVSFWLLVSGQLAASSEGEQKGMILMFHSGGALIIFALMMWRYSKRRKNLVQPMSSLRSWEQTWSVRIHLAFYILVAVMALTGILQGVFFEQDVRVFGVVNITAGHNESLMALFNLIHNVASKIFLALIALHILAAIKHQFIDKQPFLKRMA
ncbi:MAG: cytochrome b/b6 domain-containing protein [Gammaproteobacteria bacterium]|nr:cytochrome b/b6 domain-containing protein [Gammaproteobacteria bacterium]MDD9896250.1 cytochrome b/b6 domain-containing protein [Gammaproteobacteria bacterium]MDD9959544.1 cytochrome b/b6 domain-containing protein [Gammaproteobacteria bacterium]